MRALFLFSLCFLTGCAGGLQLERGEETRRSSRTVVLFLVDGLGAKILQQGMQSGKMPNTRRFFLRGQKNFLVGQAAFPSLTYPNLASVLTTEGVDAHPVAANHMVIDGKEINYESPFHHHDLERAIEMQSIFTRLKAQGKTSASFSYVLGANATDHMQAGLQEGLEYKNHEYRSLDGRLISNLEEYLEEKTPAEWPSFIYVHLVGVDGTAHLHGARSKKTLEYLAWLDKELSGVYRLLSAGEKKKQVTSMLTADHGFVDTSRFVDLEKRIHHLDRSVKVTNESRFLGLYLPKGADRAEFSRLLSRIRATPGVELTVERRDALLEFATETRQLSFGYGPATCASATYSLAPAPGGVMPAASTYRCPEELNASIQPYPLLVSGLSRYMNSAHRPDAVVIARPDTSFTKDHLGNHGGPTADEMLVPILLRGASLHGEALPHTSDLLKTLDSL